ncbi:hypothetical protein ABIF52_008692 [Bradyrhizobium japonicum]|uniref:hypothetical protein n=1 Tax=Bradyrhizobium diazoefficiens TaxID=1355477 RepID=UPI00349461F0
MTPAEALDSHRRQLAESGSGAVTVRRYAGAGAGRAVAAAADALAKVAMYKPEQIVGAVVQGDRKVILLNDPAATIAPGKVALSTLLPLSKHTDRLVIGGAEVSIEGVDDQARRIQGVLVALEIQVRG